MDDIVTETEGLVPPPLKFVTPTGTSGNVKDGPDNHGQDRKEDLQNIEGIRVREGKSSKEEKGGLINHLISTLPSSLIHPLSPKSRQVDEEETSDIHQVKDEAKGEAVESTTAGDDGGGGGFINNLISNFFNPSEGGGEDEQKRDEQVHAEATEAKEVKKEEGGGLIDNLVSHLPVSLPDDAIPAADEAAILIQSFVHD